MGYGDGIGPGDGGLGPLPFAVRATDLESFQWILGRYGGRHACFGSSHQARAAVLKADDDFALFDLVTLIERAAAGCDILAVVVLECPECEANADVNLVVRVDVPGLADVIEYGHAGVLEAEGSSLLVNDGCPGVLIQGFGNLCPEGCQLDEVEGEVALSPVLAPAGDHGLEVLGVLSGIVAGVGFSLIPNGAFDGVGHDGVNHAVEKCGGSLLVSDWGLCCAAPVTLFYFVRIPACDRLLETGVLVFDVGGHVLVLLIGIRWDPWLDTGAAPGAFDNADGNLELLA